MSVRRDNPDNTTGHTHDDGGESDPWWRGRDELAPTEVTQEAESQVNGILPPSRLLPSEESDLSSAAESTDMESLSGIGQYPLEPVLQEVMEDTLDPNSGNTPSVLRDMEPTSTVNGSVIEGEQALNHE